ncbi:MAG: MerR family transcriptional regulator [Gammaproteobacteria bacterium]|nr:MAG: MerR family transcriptional regulator [Gammaproteobacteria bacterium]UCH39122.1 MAG: MerR family transcriptional regulator [Gammaproteobacteria bacterium]
MSESPVSPVSDEPKYRIGAVCRLTGLSQHVLRVWEKRYGVVEPERSENQRRLYRESDIKRLSLLKALIDRGQAIGSIADLDNAELERRIQQSATAMHLTGAAEKPGLALFGETLALTSEDYSTSEMFSLVGHFDDISKFAAKKPAFRLDVAVIEWPSLHPDSAVEATRLANQLNARHLILVYDYAPRAALQRLASDRITALRSPLDIAALEAVVAWRFGLFTQAEGSSEFIGGVVPSRLFNDRELAHLAAQSPAIACECPMHLAQLITKLVHFEAYSAECESRNAEDAALHSYLHNTTSRARNMMERALARVMELENLSSLPES